jgi:putative phage-type endonuclease
VPALTQANDLVRARNVSASECGALMGKHPYSSPQRIFDRLTSPAVDTRMDQTEAMAIGSYLEPYVAKYAAMRMGVKVRAATKTIEHAKVNLCATPDYYVLGHPYLFEVKVSSITYGWTEDTLHPHYEWQARAQLACTGREVCFVVALVGSKFYSVPVVRDNDKEERLLATVQKFFDRYILTGIRPQDEDMALVATVEGK